MTKTIATQAPFWLGRTLMILAAFTVLGGCAHHAKMNADTRARMAKAPAIHVVHYVTPDPRINPPAARARWGVRVNLHDVPAPSEVRERMGVDLTREVANGMVRGLKVNAKLNNLVMEKQSRPLPIAENFDQYRSQYRNGMVLEVWLRHWSFTYVPVDWKTYSLMLDARARLIDVADGQVLWDTANCNFGSAGHYQNRLVLSDLKSNPAAFRSKVKTIVAQARDGCGIQIGNRYIRNQ